MLKKNMVETTHSCGNLSLWSSWMSLSCLQLSPMLLNPTVCLAKVRPWWRTIVIFCVLKSNSNVKCCLLKRFVKVTSLEENRFSIDKYQSPFSKLNINTCISSHLAIIPKCFVMDKGNLCPLVWDTSIAFTEVYLEGSFVNPACLS